MAFVVSSQTASSLGKKYDMLICIWCINNEINMKYPWILSQGYNIVTSASSSSESFTLVSGGRTRRFPTLRLEASSRFLWINSITPQTPAKMSITVATHAKQKVYPTSHLIWEWGSCHNNSSMNSIPPEIKNRTLNSWQIMKPICKWYHISIDVRKDLTSTCFT